jgi:hypothetical protein
MVTLPAQTYVYNPLMDLRRSLAWALWLPLLWVVSARAEVLPSGGSELLLQWRGEFNTAERQKLRCWLQSAGDSAAMLYGSLPRDTVRIVLERSDRARQAVPYAEVLRDDPQGARFWVNPVFGLDDFLRDWTAVHELAHLYIPFPGDADLWLSEGLATYYQNVLRARAGVITAQQAWQNLYLGFVRGQRDTRMAGLSLAQLSPQMRQTQSYLRVYWSGAAFFLQMDSMLRQQSDNAQSLDRVIQAYATCCLHLGIDSGGQLMAAFDRIAGGTQFVETYQQFSQSHGQPDPYTLLAQLDLAVQGGSVQPRKGPAEAIRTAIMAGQLPAPAGSPHSACTDIDG